MLLDLIDNEDEINYLENSLERLRGLKLLANEGLTFPEQEVLPNDDCLFTMDEYMEEMWRAMGYTVEIETATPERGKRFNYELFYDEDEMTVCEYTLHHPEVDTYLAWLKEKDYPNNNPSLRALWSAVSDIADAGENWNPDYCMTEAFVPDDYSGVMILTSWFEWAKSSHLEAALELVNYCKKMNEERRREADEQSVTGKTD